MHGDRPLVESEIRQILNAGLQGSRFAGRRVLVVIPDSTRTAPIPLMYRLLHEVLGPHVSALDFLVALGIGQAPKCIKRPSAQAHQAPKRIKFIYCGIASSSQLDGSGKRYSTSQHCIGDRRHLDHPCMCFDHAGMFAPELKFADHHA